MNKFTAWFLLFIATFSISSASFASITVDYFDSYGGDSSLQWLTYRYENSKYYVRFERLREYRYVSGSVKTSIQCSVTYYAPMELSFSKVELRLVDASGFSVNLPIAQSTYYEDWKPVNAGKATWRCDTAAIRGKFYFEGLGDEHNDDGSGFTFELPFLRARR